MAAVLLVMLLHIRMVPLVLHGVAEACADYGAFLSADQGAGHRADDRAARAAVLLGERALGGQQEEGESQQNSLEFLHHDDEELRTGCLL